jgi:hypothetical protein
VLFRVFGFEPLVVRCTRGYCFKLEARGAICAVCFINLRTSCAHLVVHILSFRRGLC